MRGERSKDGYKYFDVCSECWAIPVKSDTKKGYDFKQNGISNHAYSCSHRGTDHIAASNITKIALGHVFQSDCIRFYVEDDEILPSVRAALQLALKVRLGGRPGHLAVTPTHLHDPDQGSKKLVTIYDRVPGGSGHLTSLMPSDLDESFRSIGGIHQLRDLFAATKKSLEECACERGCYSCLLSKNNEFEHDQIHKERALNWLSRFLDVGNDGWVLDERSLNALVVDDNFDSRLEYQFVEALKHPYPGVHGISKVTQQTEHEPIIYKLKDIENRHDFELHYTSQKKVPLGGSVYTKPDFAIYNRSKVAAYLYLDGRDPHLNPSEEISTFEDTDIQLRPALANKYEQIQVLSYSYDMIKAWRNWTRHGRSKNQENFSCIDEFTQERPRVEMKKGQESWHILFGYLAEKFGAGTPLAKHFSSYRQCTRENLYIGFVATSLSHTLGLSKPFSTPEETTRLKTKVLPFLKASSSFGGLTLRIQEGKAWFEMDASQAARCDGNNISSEFTESWELFWILWHVDQSLVRVVSSESQKKRA